MRLFGSGGSPIPPEVVSAAAGLGMNVLRLYGSTEVLMATTNRPGGPAEQAGRDRRPRPRRRRASTVRDDDGRAVVGEPGEILVRGPNTCVGFFADPERTAATFIEDGWVRSGDLGVLDEDGFLTIVGRKKEIIIRGGLNIAPREIEDTDPAPPGGRRGRRGRPSASAPRRDRPAPRVVLRPGEDARASTASSSSSTPQGMATYKLPQRLELMRGAAEDA